MNSPSHPNSSSVISAQYFRKKILIRAKPLLENDKYQSVSQSFGVDNAVRQADYRMRQWEISAVPTLIVNGKYKVSPTREIGIDKILEVVDFLIQKERKFLTNSN